MSVISSLQNAGVKNVVKLRKRRQRERQGLMIIEGYRELRRALLAKVPVTTLYFCPDLYQGENEPELCRRSREIGAELLEVSSAVFQKMAYKDRPEGLLAVAPLPKDDLATFRKRIEGHDKPLLLIVEGIEKPGNLGTILRSADAAGVAGVLVCDKVTDVYNPNVVRASIGTLFTIPLAQVRSEEALKWLAEAGIPSLAATPAADTLYSQADLKPPVALVVGSEQYGLSKLWLESATAGIRIPMHGFADSLNVAQAATILMFEVVRQAASCDPGPGASKDLFSASSSDGANHRLAP